MPKKVLLLLFLVTLLAFILRFYKVTEIPPSLNWDEVSIGFNAYSILKTGRDEWNVFLPVHFKAYGEYKLPAQIYASIPGIAIFGLNSFGVRVTPIVYGTLTVLILFFLTRKLFKNDYIGLLSALFLAVSPWHIQLTRASFESSFATFWVSFGVWFLIKGWEDKKYLALSMIPFAFSVFTYNSTRVFTPLFLFVILLIYHRTFVKLKRTVLISGVIFFVLLLPLVPSLFSGERSARYKLVSITDDPGLIPRINENRGNTHLPEPLPWFIHNKVTYVSFYFTRNYLAHFSPQFLFTEGTPHKQHHVQGMGELYFLQAPFLFLGLYFLFKKKEKFRGLLMAWVLLAFIPVSMTNDSIPHALRTLVAVPFYQIISALGLYEAYLLLKKKKIYWQTGVWSIVIILGVWQFAGYLRNYYQVYPVLYSRDWQYGYSQVVDYIGENYDKYDEIVFSRHYGEPHEFTLFFLNYPPEKYQDSPNLIRYETNDWVWVLRFDKFYFASNGEQKRVSLYFPDLGDVGTKYKDISQKEKGKKVLFIGKPGDFPQDKPILKEVNFLNGNKAFEIVEDK